MYIEFFHTEKISKYYNTLPLFFSISLQIQRIFWRTLVMGSDRDSQSDSQREDQDRGDRNGDSSRESDARESSGFTIHVNMPFRWTKEDLRSVFSRYGEIVNINVPIKHNGSIKGYGFVTYKESEPCDNAIKGEDGQTYAGFRIRVELSRPREHHRDDRGRRGDRGHRDYDYDYHSHSRDRHRGHHSGSYHRRSYDHHRHRRRH